MQGVVTIMGDCNCHLGHLCSGRSTSNPDDRGKLIHDFLNHFNLFPVNLDDHCTDPEETFRTDDGKHSSTVDFIFIPLALSNSVVKACVFDWDAENLSDHIPVEVCISLVDPGPESEHTLRTKSYARKSIQWYKLSDVQIDTHYSKPLSDALSSFSLDDDIETCFQNLTDTIWSVSDENLKVKLNKNQRYFRLPSDVNKVKVELNHLHKLWKANDSLYHGMHFQVLQEKKAEYRHVLRSFLTEKENESISHLCNAVDVSKKLFWNRLKKSQGVGRKVSCFIVNDEIISGDNAII